MKRFSILLTVTALLMILIGCADKPITKNDLPGIWKAQKLSTGSLTQGPFSTLQLTFTTDSIELLIITNENGGLGGLKMVGANSIGNVYMNENTVTLKSKGAWQLNNGILNTQFGEYKVESKVTLKNGQLRLTPDPILITNKVLWSEYKKGE